MAFSLDTLLWHVPSLQHSNPLTKFILRHQAFRGRGSMHSPTRSSVTSSFGLHVLQPMPGEPVRKDSHVKRESERRKTRISSDTHPRKGALWKTFKKKVPGVDVIIETHSWTLNILTFYSQWKPNTSCMNIFTIHSFVSWSICYNLHNNVPITQPNTALSKTTTHNTQIRIVQTHIPQWVEPFALPGGAARGRPLANDLFGAV